MGRSVMKKGEFVPVVYEEEIIGFLHKRFDGQSQRFLECLSLGDYGKEQNGDSVVRVT